MNIWQIKGGTADIHQIGVLSERKRSAHKSLEIVDLFRKYHKIGSAPEIESYDSTEAN